MSQDPRAATAGRHVSAPSRGGVRRGPVVAAALAVTLGVGLVGGHVSRNGEVTHLRATRDAARADAADSRRVAEDAADRASAADHSAYLATALTHHAADRATLAGAQTRQAARKAAACRVAMRAEMHDVTVLLDILNRDDPLYTVTRIKDVEPDTRGIRRCLGPDAAGSATPTTPTPTTPSPDPTATTAPVLAARPHAD